MTHTVEIELNGQRMALETGKVAKQADGAVVVRYGGTMVLATCVAAKGAKDVQDFFPLTVEYRERAHAGGRVPAGSLQPAGGPGKKEKLSARPNARAIRPPFS